MKLPDDPAPEVPSPPSGDGEMAERTDAFDWSTTPVGPPAGWPQSLRTVVRIMLGSRYAMWLGWGAELTFFYNDAYAKMSLGPKHPWALGRPAREVWSEIWSDIGPRAQSVLRTGQATWDEGLLLFLERSGYPEETYHTFSYSPVPADDGSVGGLLCVVTEDTERTIGERRLRALRELAARTTNEARSAEDACQSAAGVLAGHRADVPFALFYLLDGAGRRAALAGASGMARETPASPAGIVLDGGDLPWPFESVAATGQAVVVDDVTRRFGALEVGPWPEPPERAVVLPMARPGQTQLAGFIVAGVSPRRPLDDAYRGFLDLLAGQIAGAVANARAYDEERQRAEALADLDRAKTAFFSNVSHEFRTPLTLMLGPLEELLATNRTERSPAVAQLEVVNRNGLRLLRLVNTLLDFSRIEAGRVRAVYRPTDLAAFTADLTSAFRSACERAGLALEVDCPPLPEPVLVDREMWEKIVLNLLSNAFKFTFAGTIRVAVRSTGDAAELRVGDTGIGIAEAEMPQLFERFHRIGNSRGRTHEGSGIGLALVQELVQLHHGSVRVESVQGVGSTFIVAVPLGEAHLPADRIERDRRAEAASSGADAYVEEALRWVPEEDLAAERSALPSWAERSVVPAGADPAGPAGGDRAKPAGEDRAKPAGEDRAKPAGDDRPRIVVADDNADMRHYIVRLLAARYRVEAAADGEAALAAIRARPCDLVLSDVMMPRLDGFGLLEALRSDPATRAVPVIMLSARAGEESRIEGVQAGADDYLVKPFSARELLARVSAHLQMARLRAQTNEMIRASEARQAFLLALGDRLRPLLDVDEIVEAATRSLGEHLGADWVAYIDVDVAADLASCRREWRRAGLASIAGTQRLSAFGPALVGELATGQTHVLTDVREDARTRSDAALYEAIGFRSFVGVPLVKGATFVNCLMAMSAAPRRWEEAEVEIVREVAERTWEAIERARAEALLRLSEERFRTLFETMDEGFCIVEMIFDGDGDGAVADYRYLETNPAFEKHTGVANAAGRTVRELVPGHEPFWFETYGRVARTGVPTRFVHQAKGLGGRWLDVAACRIGGADSRRIAILFTDITARKVAEDDRERLVGELQQQDRRKDEFLATLAHELRNPLAPLRTGLHLLKRARMDGAATEQTQAMMERQIAQMVHLIDDLMDLSRISRGMVELRRERIDLAQVVEQALETSRPLIEAGGHALAVELPGEPIEVDADVTRLGQILSNLLNNAAKYTDRGGRIVLAVERRGERAAVRVRDDGVGIPAAMLTRVFDIFTQTTASLGKAQGGLGIGLAIVKRLVELHGGTVQAYSDGPGRGSEFVVDLPAAPAPVRAAGAPTVLGVPGVEPSPLRRRILIADDNGDAADSLAAWLELNGHDVRTTADGLEAVAAASTFHPEIVLLDIGMPRLNGLDACRRMRSEAWAAETLFVAMTGWGQEEDRRQSRAAGFAHHFVKPVDPAALETLLAAPSPVAG